MLACKPGFSACERRDKKAKRGEGCGRDVPGSARVGVHAQNVRRTGTTYSTSLLGGKQRSTRSKTSRRRRSSPRASLPELGKELVKNYIDGEVRRALEPPHLI